MFPHLELIPEDGVMRSLVLTLGFRRPNYGSGIGDTLNKIENNFKNRFAVGIVDDDRRKPKLFDRYELLLKEQHFLQLRQKPKSRHYLIVVHPAVEDWLLENARIINLTSSFETRDALKRVTKDEIEVVKNSDFKQFLNTLNQSRAPGFVTLATWIEGLYEKHF
jgi:hypothetical protein